MLRYREIPPSAGWASAIECFWAIRVGEGAAPHRVTPDGCADILLSGDASVVGPMTTFRDYELAPGAEVVGVRFRPGRWTEVLGVQGDRIVDQVVRLEDVWGARRARELRDRGLDVRAVEALLPKPPEPGPAERAIAHLERVGGCASVDDLADQAGLSARQFRRVCLEQTGLTPKLLARVLRFRRAAARVQGARAAALAADCGYYDQAHLIRDFREFAGRTPGGHLVRNASKNARRASEDATGVGSS